MIRGIAFCLITLGALAGAPKKNEALVRLTEATKVFNEIQGVKDGGIPGNILEQAKCVIIVPGLKRAGFIIGGEYGKGEMVCRTSTGLSGPSTIRVEGGSVGAQIGAGETDLVLVVLNDEGARKLMQSEFKIGGDAGVMAGPVGRAAEANTDLYMRAEMLSYSRARGVFAGITLKGTTLRVDNDDNRVIYGKDVTHEDILMGKVAVPASARPLTTTLARYFRSMPAKTMPMATQSAK